MPQKSKSSHFNLAAFKVGKKYGVGAAPLPILDIAGAEYSDGTIKLPTCRSFAGARLESTADENVRSSLRKLWRTPV